MSRFIHVCIKIIYPSFHCTRQKNHVRHVFSIKLCGIEIEPSAVKDAINNQRENKIDNAEFYQGDAGEFILEQAKHGINYSVVCMDPPRKGSDEKFLKTILKTKPSKVIYISCDPATLARDLKYLSQDYSINKVTPVDMFPHTFHVETVVGLYLKK